MLNKRQQNNATNFTNKHTNPEQANDTTHKPRRTNNK